MAALTAGSLLLRFTSVGPIAPPVKPEWDVNAAWPLGEVAGRAFIGPAVGEVDAAFAWLKRHRSTQAR
jgi:hypothetical protein